jgi:hypothetical protein
MYRLGSSTGTRYSDLLELREAGFGGRTRLAFDLAVQGFGDTVSAMLEETEQVSDDAPPKRARPMKTVRKHTLAQLLGIADDGGDADGRTDPNAEPLDLSRFTIPTLELEP